MAKKFIVKPGEKVTIEINRPDKASSPKSKVRSPKGLLTSPRDDDYQARRIQPGGLQFFDLGLVKTGDVLADIDSQLIGDWTNLGGVGLPLPEDIPDRFETRDALVLTNVATAAPINPAYTTRIGALLGFDDDAIILSDADSQWSDKGFKATSAQLAAAEIIFDFGFTTGFYFDQIKIKGSGANKITAVYSFEAEAADYTLRKNDKFYLVPVYCWSFLDEDFADHLGFFNFYQQLNNFFLFFPRVPVLGGTDMFDIDAKTLPNARVERSTQSTFGGTFTNSEQPASAFESDATNSLSHGTSEFTPEGFLVAIIKQGTDTFYVWKN